MDKDKNILNLENFFINDSVEISLNNFIYAVILSALLCFVIKRVYIRSSQSLSNKEYFSDLFIPLGIITCLVITVIKFSLALSLGLVGALSIVRFRAAIKEPEELIYLFLVIGIGLACGANQFLVAISATIIISILLISLSYLRRGKKFSNRKSLDNNIIQIEIYNKNIKIENLIKLIEGNCNYLNLKSSKINTDSQLFIFWIEFKKKSDYLKITNSMKAFANKGVSISFYSSDNIYE